MNEPLLNEVRAGNGDVNDLTFTFADAYDIPFDGAFDVVTMARTLQWLERSAAEVRATRALEAGGILLVLDYNHEKIDGESEPPASMSRFYQGFLAWRASSGFDNQIADHLADLFQDAGLHDIEAMPAHEVSQRGDADFETRAGIWADVAKARGPRVRDGGFITEDGRQQAEDDYRQRVATVARKQSMYLIACKGRGPATPSHV
ncbi:MAG: methyltransferase domain-containing protein [Chloroflexota bacterium]